MLPPPPSSTLFPYTTLFRSLRVLLERRHPPQQHVRGPVGRVVGRLGPGRERVPQHRLLDSLEHRSEEHTSELQSPDHLVCRLLLEKKKILIVLCDFLLL